MENKEMTYLGKPVDWSREKAGDGYPLLLYAEDDGKRLHWDQEKYPCFSGRFPWIRTRSIWTLRSRCVPLWKNILLM